MTETRIPLRSGRGAKLSRDAFGHRIRGAAHHLRIDVPELLAPVQGFPGGLPCGGNQGNIHFMTTPRTKWTRRVPHPVLSGHAASLTPYSCGRRAVQQPGPSRETARVRGTPALGARGVLGARSTGRGGSVAQIVISIIITSYYYHHYHFARGREARDLSAARGRTAAP
jgi:hypothetical protein